MMKKYLLKSLIYYKLLVASKQGINVVIDVSSKIQKEHFNLNTKTNLMSLSIINILLCSIYLIYVKKES